MQFIPDSGGPHQIVSRLMDAVPPGSYLAMSNATLDFDPSGSPGADLYNARCDPAHPAHSRPDRPLLRRLGPRRARPRAPRARARPGKPETADLPLCRRGRQGLRRLVISAGPAPGTGPHACGRWPVLGRC
jgi:hypothetical protein